MLGRFTPSSRLSSPTSPTDMNSLTLRSAFYPLIGERIHGPIGASVDVFAVICTTCGISVSLGLGVLQINTGFNYLFGLPIDVWVQVGLIFATMALATVSVVLGLDTGIKRLSEINIVLAMLLLLLILLTGPTACCWRARSRISVPMWRALSRAR